MLFLLLFKIYRYKVLFKNRFLQCYYKFLFIQVFLDFQYVFKVLLEMRDNVFSLIFLPLSVFFFFLLIFTIILLKSTRYFVCRTIRRLSHNDIITLYTIRREERLIICTNKILSTLKIISSNQRCPVHRKKQFYQRTNIIYQISKI